MRYHLYVILAFLCLKLPLIFPIPYVIKFKLLSKAYRALQIQATFPAFSFTGHIKFQPVRVLHCFLEILYIPFIPFPHPGMSSFSLSLPQVSYSGKLLFSLPGLPQVQLVLPFLGAFPSILCTLMLYNINRIIL